MPARELFPFAEERRLFYVALTRARRSVTLITVRNRVSPFLVELVNDDQRLRIVSADGGRSSVIPCPLCGDGTIVPRSGKFGRFYGCSNFPKFKHTMREAEAEAEAEARP